MRTVSRTQINDVTVGQFSKPISIKHNPEIKVYIVKKTPFSKTEEFSCNSTGT